MFKNMTVLIIYPLKVTVLCTENVFFSCTDLKLKKKNLTHFLSKAFISQKVI